MGALRSMTIVFVNVMKLDLTKADSFERLQVRGSVSTALHFTPA